MQNFLTHLINLFFNWLCRLPVVQRLRQRFPRSTDFVLRRFDTSSFIGLPLTMLLLVIYVNISLLSELTESVIDSEGVVTLDKQFTDFLFSLRSKWLSQVLYSLTQLGTREAVFALGGLVTLVFLFRRRYVAALVFWLTMAGVGLSVQYGKKIISRDRPEEIVAFYPEHNFSFPSGHATTAISLYGMLAYFAYRHAKKTKERTVVLIVSALLILLVGFSRIYLGVHFLSDVLAGFLLGAMWILMGVSLMETFTYLQQRKATRMAKID
ncbi:phosphoesterase [Rufibacter radiotolerans]|uniref:Phosphoesterase n=1 Tax=Rufibacter radiotolerans TaxID=1379910 RepID=A0A0H4VKI5_9BACT|nr:phosphatase PAP2 family protein [Rufibacter radiotolerans]AKQ45858.1 phosphoesterase [Rufibacter radiotolerans]